MRVRFRALRISFIILKEANFFNLVGLDTVTSNRLHISDDRSCGYTVIKLIV